MSDVETKKDKKRAALFDAAYDLFVSKGINATAIDDIVKCAGVAKGTFYLYFQDKYDLLNQLVLGKSAYVIRHALQSVEKLKEQQKTDFKEEVFCFIDCLLDYFVEHQDMLQLIRKNLSRGLFVSATVSDESFQTAIERFTENFMSRGESREEALQALYILVDMAGSVLCDAIVTGSPYTLEQIKPTLYRLIGKLLD